jgi:YidC/Oxa1 family membrane protein insertase
MTAATGSHRSPFVRSRKLTFALVAMLLVWLLHAGIATAKQPPPPSDEFKAAPALPESLPVQVSGNNVKFTAEKGEPERAGALPSTSAWYKWTPEASGPVVAETCGSRFDTLLGVYTGDELASLAEIAGNDNACGKQSRVTFTAEGGTPYRIAIDGSKGASGEFTLTIRNVPAADEFAKATKLSGPLPIKVIGSNEGFTAEKGEPELLTETHPFASAWYQWNSGEETEPIVFDTCEETEFDTILTVYTGSELGALEEVDGNDDSCGEQSRAGFTPEPHTNYYIAIDGVNRESGVFKLTIREQHEPIAILRPLIVILNAILNFFHDIGFGWGMAIVLMTIVTRAALIPLTYRQLKATRALQALQPQMKEIQAKYKNDPQRKNQEMMNFYRENKVNPLGACLPVLLQLPFFFGLYYLLRGDEFKVELSGAGWLGVPNLSEPATGIALLLLLALYVVTTIISSLVMSLSAERSQRMIFLLFPFIFLPIAINFPAGLLIYWITTNFWTMGQQAAMKRLVPAPEVPTAEEKAAAKPPPPPPRKRKKRR